MTPLISVLIPAYNHERYVAECVRSAMAQDWPRMELLIVDDGSKDGTWREIQRLADEARASRKFEHVEIATQGNQGTCATLNRLCEMARGEFVAMIASDDKYLPGAFSAMMKPMLKDEQVGVVVGQNAFMDAESRECFWDKFQNVVYHESEATYRTFNEQLRKLSGVNDNSPVFGRYEELVRMNHIANGYLIRRAFLEHVLPFRKEAPLEDHWLHLQLSKICRYCAVPNMTFCYRWHAANSIKQHERMLAIADQTFKWEEHHIEALADCQWQDRYWRALNREEIDFRIPGLVTIGSVRTRTEKKHFCTLFGGRWAFRRRNLIKGFPRRCLAIVHIYYQHIWPELHECLKNIDCPYDLVITYGDEAAIASVRRDRPDARFVYCENRGFDIWPFVKVLQEIDFESYDLVVKLHTKRDCDVGAAFNGVQMQGAQWRKCLLACVSTRENWQKSVCALSNPRIGMVAQHQLICGRRACKAKNLRKTFDCADRELARVNGVRRIRGGSFVAGSMFVARASVFAKFLPKRISVGMFSTQSIHDKETYAHVCERMLGLCVKYDHRRIGAFDGGYCRMLLENKLHQLMERLARFFLQKKTTASGYLLIKICKIPIWRGLVRKRHASFLSLGYNCELAFRYNWRNHFVDTGLFQWSYAESLNELIGALEHFDRLYAGEILDPSPLYRCANTGIRQHGYLPQTMWYGGIKEQDRPAMEDDKRKLIGRIQHLKDKFVKTLRAGGALVAYKMRSEEFLSEGAERELNRLLELLSSMGARDFDFVLVLEECCRGKKISLRHERSYVRYIRQFNAEDEVVLAEKGDPRGWRRLFAEFVPAHKKRNRHMLKFELQTGLKDL